MTWIGAELASLAALVHERVEDPALTEARGSGARPQLRWTSDPDRARAAVLVLHGGTEDSVEPVAWTDSPVLRMAPFATALTSQGGPDLAVARLKFAVRGWNGAQADPLTDARWALDRVRATHPGVPIALVGHSMGGRTALRLAADPGVSTIAALAPWIHRDDEPRGGPHLAALLGHGLLDTRTSPGRTRALAAALARQGTEVTSRLVAGEAHALMRRARWWHRTVSAYVTGRLLR